MKQFIKSSVILFLALCFFGCTSLKKKQQKLNIEQFNEIEINLTKKAEVKELIGKPDRTSDEQWIYESEGSEKIRIGFNDDIVNSVSMYVWENDTINSVELLLNKISGSWVILKEPVSNPHLVPSLCYLEDMNSGKRVRIEGAKKNVEHIAKWKPTNDQISIKKFLYRNVGKEFCIASSCSKVTDPEAWKHNHCEWLEKLIAKKHGSAKN